MKPILLLFILVIPCIASTEIHIKEEVKNVPDVLESFVDQKVKDRAAEEDKETQDSVSGVIWKILEGDIDEDGDIDVALGYSLEGMGGGNNYESELALFLRNENDLKFVSETHLGGKLQIQDIGVLEPIKIEKNKIICDHTNAFGTPWPHSKKSYDITFKDGKLSDGAPPKL